MQLGMKRAKIECARIVAGTSRPVAYALRQECGGHKVKNE